MALHLRDEGTGLRDIAERLVVATGAEKGRRPSPATVTRIPREHDEHAATAAST